MTATTLMALAQRVLLHSRWNCGTHHLQLWLDAGAQNSAIRFMMTRILRRPPFRNKIRVAKLRKMMLWLHELRT